MSGTLETVLRAAGRPCLVPYVTGGLTPDWTEYLLAYQDAGADAVEVGLPFSDPMLDGPTIQEASDRALARGATVDGILADIAALQGRLSVPVAVMTYANILVRHGVANFCERLSAAGVCGLIVPDFPLDELGDLEESAVKAGIDLVLLVAPSTPPARLREICDRSRGFVYVISTMGTTGERDVLDERGVAVAERVRAIGDRPALIGFGVSTPAHAAQAARAADGVIVASALMREVLGGATPARTGEIVAQFRRELDKAAS